jgi:hypothetical protein
MYYCLPDFLLYCTYINKTSDTCGTAVKFSKDEGIFVSLATNSCRTRDMGMYGIPAQRVDKYLSSGYTFEQLGPAYQILEV